jgi:hypothetical protein
MRLIILVTGDRNWSMDNDAHKITVWGALNGYKKHNPIVVHGAAQGVDRIADVHARSLGYEVHPHPADWAAYHKAAGPIRNQEMLDVETPNLVLAFHDDIVGSKGTRDMVNRAVKLGIPIILHDSYGKRKSVTEKL